MVLLTAHCLTDAIGQQRRLLFDSIQPKELLCVLCTSFRTSHILFLLENRRIQETQVCERVPSSQFRSECWLLIACDGGAPALRQRHGWAIFMLFWRQRKFPDFHYRRQQDIGDIL